MAVSKKIQKQAHLEAAVLLAADCDGSDLQCDMASSGFTEKEAEQVREFIRNVIVDALTREGTK